jgi:hypothetical protein
MPVTLRLEGAEQLGRALARSPELLRAEELRAMTASLLLVEADARRGVAQDTRQLMNSISHRIRETPRALIGECGPSARYGVVVEGGRAPRRRWPPRAPLLRWMARHGIPAEAVFLIARKIGRSGTRARPFMAPALQRNEARIRALFGQAAERLSVAVVGAANAPGAPRGAPE